MSSSTADRPPVAADAKQISNRMSIALAKLPIFLDRHRERLQSPGSGPSSSSRANVSSHEPSTGFSRLANASGVTQNGPATREQAPHVTTAAVEREEAFFAEARAASAAGPFGGIGYVPADKSGTESSSGSKEKDRFLRGKLLGRGGAAKVDIRRKHQAVEDESDEEAGRSAIGRGKKRKRIGAETSVDVEAPSLLFEEEEHLDKGTAEGSEWNGIPDGDASPQETSEDTAAPSVASTALEQVAAMAATATSALDAKRRKSKKKKRKRKNKPPA